MEPSTGTKGSEEAMEVRDEEVEEVIESLPKAASMGGKMQLINYEGFWYPRDPTTFKKVLTFQRAFRARPGDLLVAGHPKTGTTWLKALLFSLARRGAHAPADSPLLAHHPGELVHRLESVHQGGGCSGSFAHLNGLPSPRLFSTHLPYGSLPGSITAPGGCRVLYVARNPLDTCVSQWLFRLGTLKRALGDGFEYPTVEEYFEDFCRGEVMHGPALDHALGYWAASLERPDKVLFLRYEDLKADTGTHLRRMAEFIGQPFGPEEEARGAVEEIVKLCSIGTLKELDVNKSGLINKYVEKKAYFRKGEVGDWTNYLPQSAMDRMSKLVDDKLGASGLSFQFLPN